MSILAWTFAPLIALVLATLWAHWRTRPRGPIDAIDSINQYERFRQAISGPTHSHDRRRIAGPRTPPDEVDLRDPAEVARARSRSRAS